MPGQRHRWTSEEVKALNARIWAARTPEQRKAIAKKIGASRRTRTDIEKLCPYCGVPFCGLKWEKKNRKMRPDPDKRTCGGPECLRDVRRLASHQAKVHGKQARDRGYVQQRKISSNLSYYGK